MSIANVPFTTGLSYKLKICVSLIIENHYYHGDNQSSSPESTVSFLSLCLFFHCFNYTKCFYVKEVYYVVHISHAAAIYSNE